MTSFFALLRAPRSWPTAVLLGALAAAGLLACERPGDGIQADYEQVPSARVPIALPTTATAAPPLAGSSAAPRASTSAPLASASASGSAPAGSASAADPSKPPPKTFDCGDKGKPDCPMQKWMKGVAGGAVASGDSERLARAFNAMSKAPPGFGGWAAICATGAAKAQAGDFDGAKAQCKVCHSKYQSRYHASLRDLKWP